MVSTCSSPAVVDFLDQDYHYKSVVTISHGDGWHLSALLGIEQGSLLRGSDSGSAAQRQMYAVGLTPNAFREESKKVSLKLRRYILFLIND